MEEQSSNRPFQHHRAAEAQAGVSRYIAAALGPLRINAEQILRGLPGQISLKELGLFIGMDVTSHSTSV